MVLSQVTVFADTITNVPTVGPTWATPAFVAAVATLIASITGLLVALRSQGKVAAIQTVQAAHTSTATEQGTKLDQVVTNTNGVMAAFEARITQLEGHLVAAGVALPPSPALPPAATAAPAHG